MNFSKIKELIKNRKVIVTSVVLSTILVGSVAFYLSNNDGQDIAKEEKLEISKKVEESKEENKELDKKEDSKDEVKDKEDNKTEDKEKDKEKKDNEEVENKEDVKPMASENNSKEETKPVNTSSKPANKPSSNSKPTSQVQAPSHSHNWVAVTNTVNHQEQGHYETVVVKPAWTEQKPIYEERELAICNGCGQDITSNATEHNRNHVLNGEKGGWHTEWREVQVGTETINHQAITEQKWVVDKAGWTETVTTGYKCSCGATK